MTAPTLPSLEEVQAFFKRFVENQTKVYETFKRAVQNKIQLKATADDPLKQKEIEKKQKKYHKKLKQSCDNLKKQCEVGEQMFEDSKKIQKEASPDAVKLLKNFQDHIDSLHKEWEVLKRDVSLLENEITSLLPPDVKVM